MTDSASQPLITVIVAVFNVRAHVVEAIASLQAQSFADFEALVVDDGSTDGSGEAARVAWADDPRFQLITQDNRGLSGARNAGLARARGQFLAFLDGDDAYAPEFLASLLAAIQRDGTDWAACGIDLSYPDGTVESHTAIHGVEAAGAPRCLDLTDARAVAQVFPSAWNKLYRRRAWGGLQFPEGSWFEDHEAFWAFAAASPRLAYVPEPLYRHRRDRAGQITGTDSDRVFEQFPVLARLRPLILEGGFHHRLEAFQHLATRLVHERALVVRNRARRARFLEATNHHFKAWGISYSPGDDLTISRGLGLALAGRVPVSVIVVADPANPDALTRCFAALERQSMADFQLLVLGGAEGPAHLDSGQTVEWVPRDQASSLTDRITGASVVIYGPGERPVADTLRWLVNAIEGGTAPLVFGGFNIARFGYHDGWTDNRVAGCDLAALASLGAELALGPEPALRLYPMLGNRILRPSLLGKDPDLFAGDVDLCAVQGFVLASALAAGKAGYMRLPVAEVVEAPLCDRPLMQMADWARDLPEVRPLPRGWRGTLFLRVARLQIGPQARVWPWLRVVAVAWIKGLAGAQQGAAPDPETPRWVRALCPVLRAK